VPRGSLRVYLGAAPGVGKTFRMLGEGQRRAGRGGDVVIGLLETHGRPNTAAAAEGLEVVPRQTVSYRGTTFEEMDVEAIVARHPELVLIDELAHTNVPGSANEKRWQDVVALLNAGINVVTTVNIQHLESVNDVVEKITGVPQRETVPDAVVRAAEQIELVDMTAEALRRRLAHGNVYAPEKVDAALANYFRVGNLTALRELALLWLADSVEEGLQRYRDQHGIHGPWETRERVVVALTGGPEGEHLIRRAARIAARGGADLIAVHVARGDGLRSGSPANITQQQALVESLGGRYQLITGDDTPRAVLDFARAEDATQLVVGASTRSWISRALGGLGTAAGIVAHSGSIDVHIVTHDQMTRSRLPSLASGLSRRRQALAVGVTAVALAALTPLFAHVRPDLTLFSVGLLYLVVVIAVALIGGLVPALTCALASTLLVNYYFTPPLHSFTIADHNNALALVVYVAVAVTVSLVVDISSRRRQQAARSSAEAEVLSAMAGTVLSSATPMAALLEQAKAIFHADSATLERRSGDSWAPLSRPGAAASTTTGSAEAFSPPHRTIETVGEDLRLVVTGPALSGPDIRLLRAFAAQLAGVLRTQQLQDDVTVTRSREEGDKMRTALLAAVGHDLRTPLTTVKASASTLRDRSLDISEEDRQELLAGIEQAADRLAALIANLLNMSRLAAGTVSPLLQTVAVEDLLAAALRARSDDPATAARITLELPTEPLEVLADPGLTERVLSLVLDNALSYSPAPLPVVLRASCLGDRIEIRVVDRGPGLDDTGKTESFQPFQRLGDVPDGSGVGLGLAVARGFAQAQNGTLEAEDTPGGGLTQVLTLPRVIAAADQDRPSTIESSP
jgi:two-component system sensor histidine kinase KdpD